MVLLQHRTSVTGRSTWRGQVAGTRRQGGQGHRVGPAAAVPSHPREKCSAAMRASAALPPTLLMHPRQPGSRPACHSHLRGQTSPGVAARRAVTPLPCPSPPRPPSLSSASRHRCPPHSLSTPLHAHHPSAHPPRRRPPTPNVRHSVLSSAIINWLLLVLGRLTTIDTTPRPVCLSLCDSSLKWRPYTDRPPVPFLNSQSPDCAHSVGSILPHTQGRKGREGRGGWPLEMEGAGGEHRPYRWDGERGEIQQKANDTKAEGKKKQQRNARPDRNSSAKTKERQSKRAPRTLRPSVDC